MNKRINHIALFLFLLSSVLGFGQQIDTLHIHFKTNSSEIEARYKPLIDQFINAYPFTSSFSVIGHTDDVGTNEFNQELSERREKSVLDYLISQGISKSNIKHDHFGEERLAKPSKSAADRSFNRRVEIIRVVQKLSETDETSSNNNETETAGGETISIIQPNGVQISYKRGTFPKDVETSLINGENAFTLVENTSEMRAANMLTVTTRSEGLSSLVIICPPSITPCNVDNPVIIDIPIYKPIYCSLEYVKFLNAQVEEGKTIWKEKNQGMEAITINGQQYIRIELTGLCGCINFDYKLEPPCFPMDTLTLYHPRSSIDSMEIIIESINSVLTPNEIDDSNHEIYTPSGNHDDVLLEIHLKIKGEIFNIYNLKLTDLRFIKRKDMYVLKPRVIKARSRKN